MRWRRVWRKPCRTRAALRAFGEAMEAQRWAVVEHFGRLLDTDQAGSRKQIEELEQRIRERRRLAVGLREDSEQAGAEQPE